MTALEAATTIPMMEGNVIRYPVKANTAVYKGSLVVINTSGTLEPAAANLSNGKLVGVAAEGCEAGTSKTLLVFRTGLFGFPLNSMTLASVGASVYVTDDATLTVTAPETPVIAGKLVTIEKVEGTDKAFVSLTI